MIVLGSGVRFGPPCITSLTLSYYILHWRSFETFCMHQYSSYLRPVGTMIAKVLYNQATSGCFSLFSNFYTGWRRKNIQLDKIQSLKTVWDLAKFWFWKFGITYFNCHNFLENWNHSIKNSEFLSGSFSWKSSNLDINSTWLSRNSFLCGGVFCPSYLLCYVLEHCYVTDILSNEFIVL